jgi:hypothetical protein
VVSEDQRVPDQSQGWRTGEDLRHSLEGMPLRPDAMDHVLAELKPLVEEELRALSAVERSRTLSESEHRQAGALRDLLTLAQENRNIERPA